MALSKIERARELAQKARSSHHGVYLTGPNQVEVLSDELLNESLNGENYLLASFGNCRCASDAKAIRQFDAHARVPSGTDRIALGHETLQLVLEAPEGSNVKPGDVVVVTPGHATEPIDPMTFLPSESGVLSSLGYSYRYLGGLRQFNIVPGTALHLSKLRVWKFSTRYHRMMILVLSHLHMQNLLHVTMALINTFSQLMKRVNLSTAYHRKRL